MINKVIQNAAEYTSSAYKKAGRRASRATVYAPAYHARPLTRTYLKPVNDYIDITKPAHSLYEAERISQILGVGQLRINDLDLANYINEGLAEYIRITRKKLPKIDVITEAPIGGHDKNIIMSTGISNKKRYLYVNKDFFTKEYWHKPNFDKVELQKLLRSREIKLTPRQKECVERAIKGLRLGPEDERTIHSLLRHKRNTDCNVLDCFIGIMNSPSNKKIIKRNKIHLLSFREFLKLSQKEQNLYIDSLLGIGCKIGFNNKGKFNDLFHEIGHINHENKIGSRRLDRMYRGFDGELFSKSSSPFLLDSTNLFSKKQKNHQMTSYISSYAMTCPGEFVAEMYAGILDGNNYCKELTKMYKHYHGPRIPFFTKLRNFFIGKTQ